MSLLLLLGGLSSSTPVLTGSAPHTFHHAQTGAVRLGGPSPTTDTDGVYVEIAFANNPGTAQGSMTWVNVTADVFEADGVSFSLGRSVELDTPQAGSASFTLLNNDRKYDPEYASSPHVGTLLPLRPVRIRQVKSLVSYPMFSGFLTGWPQSYNPPRVSKSHMTANDGFRLLEAADFDSGYFTLNSATLGVLDKSRLGSGAISSQLSGARVSTVLDVGQWPTADRVIDVGNSTLDASQSTGSVLAALQSASDGEFGEFYIDQQGSAIFEDRHHRISASRSKTSQATFGDGAGETAYTDITYSYSDKFIANDVTRTNLDGTISGHASDATSVTRYLRHANSISVPVSNGADLQAVAQAMLTRYKEPQFRIESLTFANAVPGSAVHAVLIGLRISDRVTVKRRPQGVGPAISQDLWIEGIAAVMHKKQQTWTLNLSPTDAQTWLVLDDATLGKLDSNYLAA